MYTELVFCAELKGGTPDDVIEVLKHMVCGEGGITKEEIGLKANPLHASSCYFPALASPVLGQDEFTGNWVLQARGNIKNYNEDVEKFLAWIKPHIYLGSGRRNLYAMVLCESDPEPTMYYLDD